MFGVIGQISIWIRNATQKSNSFNFPSLPTLSESHLNQSVAHLIEQSIRLDHIDLHNED